MQLDATSQFETSGTLRLIGPLGTAARAVLGIIAVALPIALWGIGWWDLAAALLLLPVVGTALNALVGRAYERYLPEPLARGTLGCLSPGCVVPGLVIAIAIALSYVTPVEGTAIWTWLGASWLVAAVRGDNACEAVALTNALTGKRGELACVLYAPLDAAEARRT